MSPGNGSIQVIRSSTKGGFQNWSQRNDGDKKAHGGHHMGSQSAIDHEYFSVLPPQCTAFFPNPRFFVLFGQNCRHSRSYPIRNVDYPGEPNAEWNLTMAYLAVARICVIIHGVERRILFVECFLQSNHTNSPAFRISSSLWESVSQKGKLVPN